MTLGWRLLRGFVGDPDVAFSGALAYNNAVVNWSDQTNQALSLNSEEFDTDGYHSTSVNTSRMTVPTGKGGYFLVHAACYISGTPAQDAPLYIKKNGTTVRGGQVTPYTAQPNSVGGVAQASAIVSLADGDYVEAWLYVDNNGGGGTFPVGSASDTGQQMMLAIARLGT